MNDLISRNSIPLRQRLAYTTTKKVVIISLVLGLVISLIQIYLDLSVQQQVFAKTAEQVINTMKQPATKAASDLDKHLAEEIANGLFYYDAIIEIQIHDDLGNQILSVQRPQQNNKYQWAADLIFGKRQEFRIILKNDSLSNPQVGELRVVVDTYNAAIDFFGRSYLIVTLGIVRNFFLAFVLSIFFYFVLTKPLSNMSSILKTIDPDDPAKEQLPEFKGHKEDELGILVNYTNRIFQSIGENINKRKEAEKKLQSSHDELELRVQERTKHLSVEMNERKNAQEKLKHYAKKLERSNKELSSFASITSHDLKTPIRKISNFCSYIAEEESELSENGKKYLNKIELATNHAAELIEGILDYSKLGEDNAPHSLINLNEVVSNVIEYLEVDLKEAEAKVKLGELPNAMGNKIQMEQLFENLISNSLKYCSEDDLPLIEVLYAESLGSHMQVIVKDNGKGFDNKYAEKIFDPFQRLDGDISKIGSGLGLSICKKIMLAHDGDIIAEGEIGVGAKFIILFSR
jgi:two-component system, sensor histidine kinase SagS